MTAMTARQQKAALRHVIANMSVRQQKYVLRSETALWQRAAVGLFALSLTVNIGISGAHELDRQMWSAQEARYQAQVQQAEQARELAVQELGTLRLRWSEEQEDRAAQVSFSLGAVSATSTSSAPSSTSISAARSTRGSSSSMLSPSKVMSR